MIPSYHWDFSTLLEYHDILVDGILMTFRVLALSLSSAVLLGLILAPLRASQKRWLRLPVQAVIEVVRAIPPLVLIDDGLHRQTQPALL